MIKKLQRIPLDSSMLEAAAYDAADNVLYLQFINTGKVFAYEGVPEDTFRKLLEANSVGRFVRAEILGCYADYPVRSGLDFRW